MTNTTGADARIAWLVASSGFAADERARRRDEIASYVSGDLGLDLLTPAGIPSFLGQPEDFAPAIASMSEFVSTLDPDRYPVGVLAGAIDPGLDEIRSRASVPIVGPLEATLNTTRVLGRPVAILTSDAVIAAATEEKLAVHHPEAPVVAVRNIGVSVEEIAGLMHDEEALAQIRRSIVEIGRAALDEDGAGAVQFGCMTFGTVGVRDMLVDELGVPVLDPVRIAVSVASYIALAGRRSEPVR